MLTPETWHLEPSFLFGAHLDAPGGRRVKCRLDDRPSNRRRTIKGFTATSPGTCRNGRCLLDLERTARLRLSALC